MAADKIDEEGDGSVENFLFVVDEAVGSIDEGEEADGGFEEVENAETHLLLYIITCVIHNLCKVSRRLWLALFGFPVF